MRSIYFGIGGILTKGEFLTEHMCFFSVVTNFRVVVISWMDEVCYERNLCEVSFEP